MGYGTRGSSSIRTFEPDDTEKEMYISSDSYSTMQEILDKIKEKWGENQDLDNIRIEAEHIHTDCLGYDRYDPSDYTNYLHLTKID